MHKGQLWRLSCMSLHWVPASFYPSISYGETRILSLVISIGPLSLWMILVVEMYRKEEARVRVSEIECKRVNSNNYPLPRGGINGRMGRYSRQNRQLQNLLKCNSHRVHPLTYYTLSVKRLEVSRIYMTSIEK